MRPNFEELGDTGPKEQLAQVGQNARDQNTIESLAPKDIPKHLQNRGRTNIVPSDTDKPIYILIFPKIALALVIILIIGLLVTPSILQSIEDAASVQVPIPDFHVKNITLMDKHPAGNSRLDPTVIDQDNTLYNVYNSKLWDQMVIGDSYQIGWTGDNPIHEIMAVSHIDPSWVVKK